MSRVALIFFVLSTLLFSRAYSQNYFSQLDTNLFLNQSVIQLLDSSFIFAGDLWSIGGSRSVSLSDYNKQGNYIDNDTFNFYPTMSSGGIILQRPTDYVVANIINYLPPFDSELHNIELTCFSYAGTELWAHEYGGTYQETHSDLIETSDGGLMIVGTTDSYGVNGDFYIIKTDVDGNLEWDQNYGTNNTDIAYSIIETQGGYIVAGSTHIAGFNWDIYMIKIDLGGNIVWEKTFGGGDEDYGGIIMALQDESFLIHWNVSAGGNTVAYLQKLDGNGDEVWTQAFPYLNYSAFNYARPLENQDATIMVSCSAVNSFGKVTHQFIKLDPFGDTIWTREYFTMEDYNQYIYDAESTLDGGYIMCGSARDSNLVQCAWIIKTDCNGNEGVQHPLGAPCDYYDCTLYPIDANFTPDAILVDLAVDPTITFTNTSANTTSRVWNFGDGTTDYTDAVISHTYTQAGTYDVSLIVFHGMCSDTMTVTVEVINSTGIEPLLNEVDFSVFPNPTNGMITLSTSHQQTLYYGVQDIYGREIISTAEFSKKAELDLSDLSPGIYLVVIENESKARVVKRIIKN